MVAAAAWTATDLPGSLQAAKVKLGPLEVDTDPATPAPEGAPAPSAQPPYEAKSESPKKLPLGVEGEPLVYHAVLHDVVDLGVAPFLERVIEEAQEKKAAAVIVEIDTPGGRVDAAVKIKDVLLHADVPTVAFINKQAISAGALIAYAHDYIIWSNGATMGAATPIQMDGGGEAQPVEEKMVSYMRGVMRSTAEAKGRDGFVAEAMVDADIELPPHAPKGKLLTATFTQAEELGLSDGTAETFDAVLELLGLSGATVVKPEVNWAEEIARLLTHPVASSLLMTIGILGILIELYTPGFGLAGIAGLLSLFLFFAGHLVVKLAGLEEILLFGGGVVLLLVELLVLPGFGIAGVLGLLLMAASFILALVGLRLDIAWDTGLLADALLQFAIAVSIAGIGMMLMIRYLPSTGLLKRLVLTATVGSDAVAAPMPPAQGASLIGKEGVALTHLRPAGRALIEGEKLDVSSVGELIDKGRRIRVVSVDGPRIAVEAIESSTGSPVPQSPQDEGSNAR